MRTSLAAYLAIVLVVWTVIVIPDRRLRSIVYALPIPMSIALMASTSPPPGTMLLGVPLLVAFFLIAALLEPRTGRLVAVAVSLATVVAVSTLVHHTVTLSWPQAYGVVPLLWLVGGWVATRLRRATRAALDASPVHAVGGEEPKPGVSQSARALASAAAATAVSFLLGSWLGPFVVTFPYSGVPVALLLTKPLPEFAADFAWRSVLLVVFLAAFREASLVMSAWPALAVGWAAYGVAMAALGLVGRANTRR